MVRTADPTKRAPPSPRTVPSDRSKAFGTRHSAGRTAPTPSLSGSPSSSVDRRPAGLADVVPHAGSHAGEDRDAVSGALGGVGQHDRLLVDIGLELAPEGAAGAAAAGADVGDVDPHAIHDLQSVAHAEGDALHQRA